MAGQVFINEIVKASFNLRQPKSKRPTNIYLIVRINQKQAKLSTGVKVYPDQWNIKKQEAYISCRLTESDNINNTITNKKLLELRNQFEEFKRYLCDNPNKLENCWDILREYIYKDSDMRRSKKINAIHWLRNAIANDKTIKTSGERKGASTMEMYQGQLKSFDTFLKETDKGIIGFEDINLGLIKEYETYLFNRTVKKGKTTSTNTVANKCVQLIGIIKRAEAYNLIDIHESKLDRYTKPKSRQGNENEIYLSEDDINKIYSLKLSGKEEIVRDLFVLQCWTGQRFSDIQSLNKGIIKNTTNGQVLEIVQTKKTHRVTIPLFPITTEILRKYNFDLPTTAKNTTLNYLKKIGLKAGLTEEHIVTEDRGGKVTNSIKQRWELIGTHTARRSYISNMLKHGYDSHLLMKITGHTTEEAFKRYVKVSSGDVASLILKTEADRMQHELPKELSQENNVPMNSNQTLKLIKEGIEEGLKPLKKELSDIKEVMQYITINKRSIRPVNARRLIAMVVSLEKDNTPAQAIINMLEASGIIGSVSVTMTGGQYFPMQNMNERVLDELKTLAVEEKDLNNK
ncbi:phage integrase SAM-like domain-containing protein [Bacteroides thetaiotaomicron]|jgi:site-specific recombinase XerD|uniref:phage integrase SAM-like domain-containing protein n=1 Tax=Bacteroides thetaiotaomicron TaxID=818 RepID=UPI0032C1D4F0